MGFKKFFLMKTLSGKETFLYNRDDQRRFHEGYEIRALKMDRFLGRRKKTLEMRKYRLCSKIRSSLI